MKVQINRWIEEQGHFCPEYNATEANWKLWVGNHLLTRHYNWDTVLCEDITSPLYTLGIWLADNWWNILYDYSKPSAANAMWHQLEAAQSGFVLPRLEIKRTANYLHFTAKQKTHNKETSLVQFVCSPFSYLMPIAAVEANLKDFLRQLKDRLDAKGVVAHGFEEGYRIIFESSPEEQAFCKLAAEAGYQPYDMDDDDADALIALSNLLPDSLEGEIIPAFGLSSSSAVWDKLSNLTQSHQKKDSGFGLIGELKQELLSKDNVHQTPWQRGYHLASVLRGLLPNPRSLNILKDLKGRRRELFKTDLAGTPIELRGAMVLDKKNAPVITLRDGYYDSLQSFAFARLLYNYFVMDTTVLKNGSVATDTSTELQQAGRAFAAELLAPAELIKEAVADKSDEQPENLVQHLAGLFHVGEVTIKHQMQNHGLASFESEQLLNYDKLVRESMVT